MIRLALTLTLLAGPAFAQAEFDTPQDAHKHCPHDAVVWLNTNSGIYHFAGERWYGKTEEGDYVCQREANAADDRGTENGQ